MIKLRGAFKRNFSIGVREWPRVSEVKAYISTAFELGALSVTVELPLEAGELIEKAFQDQRDHYENPPRGGLLSTVERLANEPAPPRYFH